MERFVYMVPGDPIPLARARISQWNSNKGRRMWDSQKQAKLHFGIAVRSIHEGKKLYTGPVSLDVVFYMAMPKTMSKKKQQELSGKPHVYTPDLSNMLKFVEDAATGVLWDNDCIIAYVSAQKIYDVFPRTEFTVSSLVSSCAKTLDDNEKKEQKMFDFEFRNTYERTS